MSDKPVQAPRLGDLLVTEGVITEDQLLAVLKAQKTYPQFTLGQLLNVQHKVPLQAVDNVILHRMVLPLFTTHLLEALDGLAAKDRFARGLVPSTYVRDVEYVVQGYQTQTIEAHRYQCSGGCDLGASCTQMEHTRFVLTQADLRVNLQTTNEATVSGEVRIRHQSQHRRVRIADENNTLSSTLYYDLKRAWLQSKGA